MRAQRQVEVLERLLARAERSEPEPQVDWPARDELQSRPIAVGRAEELPEPGAFFTHDATGTPLLLTRDEDGNVHAMRNVCRHRGTRLVDAVRGSANAFVCPYHAWTYDLRGNLGHLPTVRSSPLRVRDESSLVELPCEVRHGFLWVVPKPSREALSIASYLEPFDEDLEAFELASHVVIARSESVHGASWRPSLPAALTYTLSPNTILVFHPEEISWLQMFPRAEDEVVVVHTTLARRAPA